jgi:hypothetical protein
MDHRASGVRPSLYLDDETAWLERMAGLIAEGRLDELDYEHLAEYLSDMARRDRREVYSRLKVLLVPERRGGSWRGTILTQRGDLRLLLESGTLRNHGVASLEATYREARRIAAAETGLPIGTFPEACPFTIDELIAPGADDEPA